MRSTLHVLALMSVLTACAADERPPPNYPPHVQVTTAERAFAKSLADRDLTTFGSFISEEAVFVSEDGTITRGRAAVIDRWKKYFEVEGAPFSWKPEQVVALDSGTLALSTGPVFDPDGKQTGTFNSIWRKEDDGKWRIVFDKGAPHCPEAEE